MKSGKVTSGPDVFFYIAREAIEGHGEDSWYCATDYSNTLLGVFDGSGGIGAQTYCNYKGHTGAYMAARAVSGGVKAWYKSKNELPLESMVQAALGVCTKYADNTQGIKIKGSLRKDFPTTMAMLSLKDEIHTVIADCFWAGDSRCYVLDGSGLHQLTEDDIANTDPMANLAEDGVLKNVINASVPYVIHHKTYEFIKPCILLTATDGCFGYLPSPMHFENLLIESLEQSESICQWKDKMDSYLRECAGDDYTMCIAGYGYSCFYQLKKSYKERCYTLKENYLTDGVELQRLWGLYKKEYCKYL